MKKYFFIFLLSPCIVFGQVKKAIVKKKTVTKTAIEKSAPGPAKPADGYTIKGTVTGLADGSSMQMLNGSTGAAEQSTTVQNGKFVFKGKMTIPDFKVISPNGQPPFITLFADNSEITINAQKDNLEKAEIKGSASHNDYTVFVKITKPYEDLLNGKGRYDVKFMDEAAVVLENFTKAHTSSFVAPIAVFKYNQITGDYAKLEELYNLLSEQVKTSPISAYLAKQITENQNADYGKPIANFSQADTSGKEISLMSFKGKYVLVDFWASWCGPCRRENPNVVDIFEKYKDKNFTVLGVSLDRAKESWIDAINADRLNWTHVSDLQFWSNAVAQQFHIQNIPQNFLLDPQGNLVAKNLRGAALEYRLSKLLK